MSEPLEDAEESPSGSSLRGSHRLQAWKTCPRMAYWRYWCGYRAKKHVAHRDEGTLFHACFQYWYAGMMTEPPAWWGPDRLYPHLLKATAELPARDREEKLARVAEGFAAYRHVYEHDKHALRPVAVEVEYQATVGELDPGGPDRTLDDEVVTCRPDLVYEFLATGDLWCLDFKTLGRSRTNLKAGGKLYKFNPLGEWALNFQVLLNLKILRLRLGEDRVAGFKLQRCTRQRTWDFDRSTLTIPKREYQEFGRTVREFVRLEREIVARAEQGIEPLPYYECMGRFGTCDYRAVCLQDTEEKLQALLNNRDSFDRATDEELTMMRQRLRVIRG